MADIKCNNCGFTTFEDEFGKNKSAKCLSCGQLVWKNNSDDTIDVMIECGKCQKQISKNAPECPKCGWQRTVPCNACGEKIPYTSISCPECGDPRPFKKLVSTTKVSSASMIKRDKFTDIKKGIYIIAAIFFALIVYAIAGVIGKELGKSFFKKEPSQEQIENKLIEGFNKEVGDINSKCPMMVDEITRMDRASVGPGAKVTYYYTFPNYSSSDVDSSIITNDLFLEVKGKVCVRPEMIPYLQYGATYEYSYSGNDNIKIASFEIDRIKCGLSLQK